MHSIDYYLMHVFSGALARDMCYVACPNRKVLYTGHLEFITNSAVKALYTVIFLVILLTFEKV